jgi:hydroxymethylglutaryl-CoA reductase
MNYSLGRESSVITAAFFCCSVVHRPRTNAAREEKEKMMRAVLFLFLSSCFHGALAILFYTLLTI